MRKNTKLKLSKVIIFISSLGFISGCAQTPEQAAAWQNLANGLAAANQQVQALEMQNQQMLMQPMHAAPVASATPCRFNPVTNAHQQCFMVLPDGTCSHFGMGC